MTIWAYDVEIERDRIQLFNDLRERFESEDTAILRLDELESFIADTVEQSEEFEKTNDELTDENESYESRVTDLEYENTELKDKITKLENELEKLKQN